MTGECRDGGDRDESASLTPVTLDVFLTPAYMHCSHADGHSFFARAALSNLRGQHRCRRMFSNVTRLQIGLQLSVGVARAALPGSIT